MYPLPMTWPTRLRRLRRLAPLALALVVAPTLAACSSEPSNTLPSMTTYPVKGKVLLANGKPMPSGRVLFRRIEGPPIEATGMVQSDGTFELTTKSPGDGAPAGEYAVRFDPTPADVEHANPKTAPKIPPKYLEEEGLGKHVRIKPEPTTLEPFLLK